MGQLFVSYSRHDIEIADALVSKLANAGLEVWIDRQDIRAGRHWRTEIVTAIDECDALLLLLSPHSVASDNVLKEVTLAEGANRRIFPVFIQETELLPDMRYLLAGVQFIDFTGDNMDTAYEQLESGLLENQRLIEESAAKMEADTGSRETEIVIQGVNMDKFDQVQQEKLLSFLAEMTDTDSSQMKIVSMQTGSVHVFIQMSAETAFSLKTLALNGDPRFKKMRISAIHVAGTGIVMLSLPFWLSFLAFLSVPAVAITSAVAVTTLVVVGVSQGAKIFNRDTANSATSTETVILEHTPSETKTVQLDQESTATETSEPFTLTATEALELTETETPTPVVVEVPSVTAIVTTRCRSTFNLNGDAVSFFNEGDTAEVLGVSQDGHWFYISPPGSGQRCWVSDATVTFSGSTAGIQIWYPTATPTFTPVPTASPTSGVPGSIAGMVWEDTDHDGVYLYYDYPFYGVTVYLKDFDCMTVLNTTVTDTDGEFYFSNVPAGNTYCVEVDHTTLPFHSTGYWDPATPDFPINVSPKLIVKVGAGGSIIIDFRYLE